MHPTEFPSTRHSLPRTQKILWLQNMQEKCERPCLHPVFGFSILSYCGNMAVQNGEISESGPVPSLDMTGSFSGNENNTILIFRKLYTNENILMKSIFMFLPKDAQKSYTLDL